MTKKVIGWAVTAVVGITIPNPRSVVRMIVPPNLTPEQYAAIEAEIDRINAAIDAENDRYSSLEE